ncbi:MAG: LacI family DNA-binding transcriptional regulator [Clostridia bacterium]|nr:LacI family DNA-binding transcriptional regulator [Clostridia bacterium]
MKSDELRRIAEHSGTSVSTVRRVLNHCAGITEETRRSVIDALDAQHSADGYSPSRRVHIILPDNPKFFWHRAFDVFNSHPFSPPAQFSFYPSLAQHDVLQTYLEPLLTEKHSVLIYSANLDAAERSLVERIADHSLVIQLGEYTPLPGTVFVGSDSYGDGVRLGQLVAAHSRTPHVALLSRPENINMCERCRGFVEGLGAASVHYLNEPEEQPLYASLLARLLNGVNDDLDFVFSPSGRTIELCQALYKLRKQSHAVGIGYELSPRLRSQLNTAPLFAVLEQNIAEQTRIALRLSDQYLSNGTRPKQERYITSSILWKIKDGKLTK